MSNRILTFLSILLLLPLSLVKAEPLVIGSKTIEVASLLPQSSTKPPLLKDMASQSEQVELAPLKISPILSSGTPVNGFARVVAQIAPSVVNIYSSKLVKHVSVDPFFKAFPSFGGMDENFFFGMPVDRIQKSLGSGVIIRKNGLVVTNFHVVDGGQEIKIILNDNREYQAKIVMMDKNSDLALLKIDALEEDLPAAEIRDADELSIGDDVLVIGNPYGIGQSVSKGIVAAMARRFGGAKDFRSYIQTDAAVNKGNSGGALISVEILASGDIKGRVVGVTTAIASTDGGFQGLSFAVPSNMIKPLVASYDRGLKTIERAWIGLNVQALDYKLAQSMELKTPSGVLVTGVYADSPGEKSGLKIGDLISHINGKPILNDEEYHFRVNTCLVGDKMKLSYTRAKVKQELELSLVAPPEKPTRDEVTLMGAYPFSGATVLNLSPALANELSIDPMKIGVMIFQIKRASAAHRLGLRPGDIIISYNAQPTGTVKSLLSALEKKSSEWIIDYKRGDKTYTIKIGLDETTVQEKK